jgi:hypothetical protein
MQFTFQAFKKKNRYFKKTLKRSYGVYRVEKNGVYKQEKDMGFIWNFRR